MPHPHLVRTSQVGPVKRGPVKTWEVHVSMRGPLLNVKVFPQPTTNGISQPTTNGKLFGVRIL